MYDTISTVLGSSYITSSLSPSPPPPPFRPCAARSIPLRKFAPHSILSRFISSRRACRNLLLSTNETVGNYKGSAPTPGIFSPQPPRALIGVLSWGASIGSIFTAKEVECYRISLIDVPRIDVCAWYIYGKCAFLCCHCDSTPYY